jgi:PAS domain-containing protein
MLASQQPMFVAWGPEHLMLYNDGYARLCRDCHPSVLGRPLEEVWYDIIDDLQSIIDSTFAGVATHMDDISFELHRDGKEEAHFSFSCTPVRDESGSVTGLFCVCTETTSQVIGERRLAAEVERQRRLFELAPGFICILQGPEHVFVFANEAYRQLVGGRDLIGKRVREAFPELGDKASTSCGTRSMGRGNGSSDEPCRSGLSAITTGPARSYDSTSSTCP